MGQIFGAGGVGQKNAASKNGMGLNALLFNYTLQKTLCLL